MLFTRDTAAHLLPSADTRKKNKPKLYYPSWKSVLIEVMEQARMRSAHEFDARPSDYGLLSAQLDVLREILMARDLNLLFSQVPSYDSTYYKGEALEHVMQQFKSLPIRPNEFYAVFDLHACRYREMDQKIDDLLGLNPEDFNIPALMQSDAYTHIFHVRDHYHMLRWACLAQMMVATRMFKWKSLEDQFRIRFRVRTQKSSNASYREHEYITLEKLCFLYNGEMNGSVMPQLHIDKWLIFDRSEFDHVRPMWISNIERQSNLNDALYLFNASLIQFPVQYLVYLHERNFADRNKMIAHQLNEHIGKHTGIQAELDEQQVADCFAKTIRPRMMQTVNSWEHRRPGDLASIESDVQAVAAAKALGLLPIPERILKTIYKNITAF